MSVAVFTSFGQQSDSSGNPLSGGSVTVYQAGTTTPITLKAASDLSGSAAANPIVLDSAGRHAIMYFALQAYKVLLKNSAGATIATVDNIDPGIAIGTGALAIANGGTGATSAGAALTALGGATAASVADIAAQVAAVTGALGSTAKTHIATGTTGQRDASPAEGDIRRNTTVPQWEGYVAGWQKFVTDSTILVDFRAAVPAPTRQYLTSGSSATYTAPTNPAPRTLVVKMIGGGGGGGAAATNAGSTGGNTIFNSINANGGSGGPSGGALMVGGVGGTGGTGSATARLSGGDGAHGASLSSGSGGVGPFGGAGGSKNTNAAGTAGKANTGAGGSGGSDGSSTAGGGGGSGEYAEIVITSPSATYTYTIGAGGAGGTAGTKAGGAGGTGLIIVEEYY